MKDAPVEPAHNADLSFLVDVSSAAARFNSRTYWVPELATGFELPSYGSTICASVPCTMVKPSVSNSQISWLKLLRSVSAELWICWLASRDFHPQFNHFAQPAQFNQVFTPCSSPMGWLAIAHPPGMMPILHSPGLMMPGQLGPATGL